MRAELPCLPLIQERFFYAIKDELSEEEKKYYPKFKFTMFCQIWGNTALGFGGIGGNMITSAYTTVVEDKYSGWCGVFFGERLAYKIKNPNQKFREDIYGHHMKPFSKRYIYMRDEEQGCDNN
jgi:hypothetical protein